VQQRKKLEELIDFWLLEAH